VDNILDEIGLVRDFAKRYLFLCFFMGILWATNSLGFTDEEVYGLVVESLIDGDWKKIYDMPRIDDAGV
jgi:hypothetical protein